MQLAILIYNYFPYGGLQRDMRYTVEALLERGHECRIYCRSWQGEAIAGAEVCRVAAAGFSNHARNKNYQRSVQKALAKTPADLVLGFDKMPGLDLYFAGDSCYLARMSQRGVLSRRGARFRHFADAERAVFAPESATSILLLTEQQRAEFVAHYGTLDQRMTVLPPGIPRDRRAPEDAPAQRRAMREQLGLQDQELTLLFIASAFANKGLDRAITALAHLCDEQPSVSARLLVVGEDGRRGSRRLARRLGILDRLTFLGGREDIGPLMLAADLLVHPARTEAAGMVLLEALAMGLPVVTTDNCGYAPQVAAARAGFVLPGPFSQAQLDKAVMRFIDGIFRADCRETALRYAKLNDLYAMHSVIADQVEALLEHRGQSVA